MATMRCAAGVALLAALVHAEVNLLCGLKSRCKSVEEARRVGFETLEYMKKHSPLEGLPESNLKKVVERECARVSDKWPSERTPSRRWVCLKRGRIYVEDLMNHDAVKRGEKWSRKDTKLLVPKIGTGVWFRIENGKLVKSMWYSRNRVMQLLNLPLQHMQAAMAYASMFGVFKGLTFEFVAKDCDGCICSPFEGRPNERAEGFRHFPIATFNKHRGACDYLKTVPVQPYHHRWSRSMYPDPPPAWETLNNTAFFRGEIWNEMRAGLVAISALDLVPDTDMATTGQCHNLDFHMSIWRRPSSPAWTKKINKSHTRPRPHGSMCRAQRTEWRDQVRKYKYHVSGDGICAAVKFWWTLRATGVLVSSESAYADFHEEQIIPFVHYLSVPKKQADMPESMREVMAWARSNDNITREISKEGNLYFEEHASPEGQMLSVSLYAALMAELWDDSLSNDPLYDLEKVTKPTRVSNHPDGLTCLSGRDTVFPDWSTGGGCAEQNYPVSLPTSMVERAVGTPRDGTSPVNATPHTTAPTATPAVETKEEPKTAQPAAAVRITSFASGRSSATVSPSGMQGMIAVLAFVAGCASHALLNNGAPRKAGITLLVVSVLAVVLLFSSSSKK